MSDYAMVTKLGTSLCDSPTAQTLPNCKPTTLPITAIRPRALCKTNRWTSPLLNYYPAHHVKWNRLNLS